MAISTKQARLISAIRDAMECQGVSQSELSRKAGTSQGMMSQALGGKGNMGEEKWRMCCEALGLDYDEVVADPNMEEREREIIEEIARKEAVEREERERCETAAAYGREPVAPPKDEEAETTAVAAQYIAKNLKREISQGTDMGLNDLYMLLKFCGRAIAG